jgi:hypothetical protein
MCGPWVLPLALIAGGSIVKQFGNSKANHAEWNAFNAEDQRQKAFTDQQQHSFEDSLGSASSVYDPAAIAKAAGARDAVLQTTVAPVNEGTYLPGVSSAPAVVHGQAEGAANATHAQASALASALARLGGVNDQILGANINSAHNAARIGQLGSFKAGSAGVLDSEMKAAAHKGAFLRGIGGLAQQIGMTMAGNAAGGAIGASPGISSSITGASLPSPGFSLASLLRAAPVY